MNFRQHFEKLFNKLDLGIWGIIGSSVILIFVLISINGFKGQLGEPYSILNHFVSELGELGNSDLAILCNLGLIIGGLIFAFYMLGLGLLVDNKWGKIGGGIGVFSSLSSGAVGFVPADIFLFAHGFFGMCYFISGLITTIVFQIAILTQKEVRIPKSFIIGGLLLVVVYTIFLISAAWPDPYSVYNRPIIWLDALFEWGLFFTVNGWLIFVSIYLVIKKPSIIL
jgi:hypothetical protein